MVAVFKAWYFVCSICRGAYIGDDASFLRGSMLRTLSYLHYAKHGASPHTDETYTELECIYLKNFLQHIFSYIAGVGGRGCRKQAFELAHAEQ